MVPSLSDVSAQPGANLWVQEYKLDTATLHAAYQIPEDLSSPGTKRFCRISRHRLPASHPAFLVL
jgi:hypothetical protein